MTLLEAVNRVLRRLREDEVADTSSVIAQTIVEFMSDIHAEVIEAHDWSTMIRLDQTTIAAGNTLADTAVPANALRKVISTATWHDSVSDQTGSPIKVVHRDEIYRMYNEDRATEGSPQYAAFYPDDTNELMKVVVYPANNAEVVIRSYWHVPETPITVDTDEDYEFVAPARPIYLGTLYLALNEGGEELGEPGNIAETRYYNALAAAKESDIQLRGQANEYEFYKE